MDITTLLKLIEVDDALLENGTFLGVDVNVMNNQWEFRFSYEDVMPIQSYLTLKDALIKAYYQYRPVLIVGYTNELVPSHLIPEYYEYAYEKARREFPRIEVLEDYDKKLNGSVLFEVPHEQDEQIVLQKLNQLTFELQSVGVRIAFEIDVTEDGPSPEELIKDQLESYQETAQTTIREAKQRKVVSTNPVLGKPHNIKELPNTLEMFEQFATDKIVLEGYIFQADSVTYNGGSTQFWCMITDFNDSIKIRKFVRTRDPQELDVYKEICKKGNYIRCEGRLNYDKYRGEVVFDFEDITTIDRSEPEVMDTYEKKRVELHVHSKMSSMDGITSVDDYVKKAVKWGHKAIAITDHNTVQSFPEFSYAVNKTPLKPIYGCELSFVDDSDIVIARGEQNLNLMDSSFVVFDIETTGLSVNHDDIIEISAVRIEKSNFGEYDTVTSVPYDSATFDGYRVTDYSTYVSTSKTLSPFTTKLTGITEGDLVGAPNIKEVLSKFVDFAQGSILVAHNADFDMSHLYENLHQHGLYQGDYPTIDTLNLARVLYDGELKKFNLKAVSKKLGVSLKQHHRAIYDAFATAEIFMKMRDDLYIKGIKYHNELNGFIPEEMKYKMAIPKHVTALVKNRDGLVDLYKVLSDASTKHFFREPRTLRSVLDQHREHLLIGSSCVNGAVFQAALNSDFATLQEQVKYYDYLEVQPPSVYDHLVERNGQAMKEQIVDAIKRIVLAGSEESIPVIASGDVHHLYEDQVRYRKIYMNTPLVGGGLHPLKGIKDVPSMHLRTTEEMMQAFDGILEKETIKRIVVEETNTIADQIETFDLFPKELFVPKDDFFREKGVLSIKEEVNRMVWDTAHKMYGKHLHPIIEERINQELSPIIDRGFANVYYISHLLVKHSLEKGYLVGSRGSVGSSFIATLMNITEVNPLPPHYVCPDCGFTLFKQNEVGFDARTANLQDHLQEVDSGFDLPFANCPRCGQKLKGEGQDIPFATFLGFKGDKVPDIDLNFSGEYQGIAHEEIRRMFGKEFAFRAGTISTVKEKTAYGYVKGYTKDNDIQCRDAEISRQVLEIQDVRRSTGQHPGGIVVVPHETEIYNITPIQYPADDISSTWRTTHFDYHSFESNLFKLDVLGHDDPTTIRVLMDYVEQYPDEFPFSSVYDINVTDEEVLKIFRGTESLHADYDVMSNIGTYGVPEFGTQVTRRLLEDTHPKNFSELVKISGLSHGTDVWMNNAKDLIEGKTNFGEIPFHDVIGCRDDIMIYLMYQGLSPADAYDITETARKTGKYLNQDQKNIMIDHSVPEWYIWSCDQIKYMFPKAHAVAYVMSALRIAWFKVHRPIYFYAAYLSVRADQFDVEAMVGGYERLKERILSIREQGMQASDVDKKTLTVLEVALEMTARGYSFENINLERSASKEFVISEDKKSLILPFITVPGLGESVGDSIVNARQDGPFTSIEDLKKRTRVSKTIVKKFVDLEVLDLEEKDENQLSLFNM